MSVRLQKIEDKFFKTKDLIRVLCDTVQVCMEEQRPMHHIATLCPVIFEQLRRTESLFDEYIQQDTQS